MRGAGRRSGRSGTPRLPARRTGRWSCSPDTPRPGRRGQGTEDGELPRRRRIRPRVQREHLEGDMRPRRHGGQVRQLLTHDFLLPTTRSTAASSSTRSSLSGLSRVSTFCRVIFTCTRRSTSPGGAISSPELITALAYCSVCSSPGTSIGAYQRTDSPRPPGRSARCTPGRACRRRRPTSRAAQRFGRAVPAAPAECQLRRTGPAAAAGLLGSAQSARSRSGRSSTATTPPSRRLFPGQRGRIPQPPQLGGELAGPHRRGSFVSHCRSLPCSRCRWANHTRELIRRLNTPSRNLS